MTSAANAADFHEALRVSQLDATELDRELFQLVKHQVQSVFKYFKPNLLVTYGPEVNAFLRFLLWHNSINKMESSIGQKLLDIRYIDEAVLATGRSFGDGSQWMNKKQKLLFGLLTVCCPWIGERSQSLTTATRHSPYLHSALKVLGWLGCLWKAVSLVNFLLFLVRGKHQFLVERLLNIRAVFPRPHGVRQVGFELMDREILWHGFAEFLFFVLPLINFRKIKNFVTKRFTSSDSSLGSIEHRSEFDYKRCAVCTEWPFNPHQIGCRYVFCYYCIQSNFKADPSFSCPECGKIIGGSRDIEPVPIISNKLNIQDKL